MLWGFFFFLFSICCSRGLWFLLFLKFSSCPIPLPSPPSSYGWQSTHLAFSCSSFHPHLFSFLDHDFPAWGLRNRTRSAHGNPDGDGDNQSKRKWGTGSLKPREGETTGISAEKPGFRKEEEQMQAQRKRVVSFPLPSMAVSLGESRTRERPPYPPVFLIYRKYTRAAIRAITARTPITMPAIAPAERPKLPCVESSVEDRKEKNE